MHSPHEVFGVSPVSLGFDVSESEFFAPDSFCDFLGDKLVTSQRTFVVEEYSAGDINSVAFTVVNAQAVSQ